MALTKINPHLELTPYASEFVETGRVQVRDVLTDESARALRAIVKDQTPWGLAWRAGNQRRPNLIEAEQLALLDPNEARLIQKSLFEAMGSNDYAFAYSSYPLAEAPSASPHKALLKDINDRPFLDLLRGVSGVSELVMADGQATLYAPGHFLAAHDDSDSPRGRRIAYVLNLTMGEWRPEWGGYLNFYNNEGDVERAMRPRFNSLNVFRVPQWHSVGHVAPFAPTGRFAITGWAHDQA